MKISKVFKAFLDKKITLKGQIDTYTGINDIFEADFVFSIGGDGTLLETVTHIGRKEYPILGINSGRLGFLAITPCEIATTAIKSIFDGDYNVDERTLIRLESEENIFEGLNFGLNEFAILKSDTSSMIVVHTYLDGDYLNSYWADGLIVSTPTGSTGYSLSCGGPIVFPHTSNFTISPVSPHNLNVRPIVVSDSSVISFEIEGRSKNFLVSLDSRSKTVDTSIKLAVKKEDFKAKLVKVGNENFLNTLRNKLNWGLDIRN
ncbi:MAG: NAD kinase [Bacteroidetes bacterium]|nr:NAD kinase [Bacteroidota bacterium]